MSKVRIGIIGIGEIGTTKHLTQLCRHTDEVEIAALCDIIPERCEKAIKDFGLNAKIYTDYKELVQESFSLNYKSFIDTMNVFFKEDIDFIHPIYSVWPNLMIGIIITNQVMVPI